MVVVEFHSSFFAVFIILTIDFNAFKDFYFSPHFLPIRFVYLWIGYFSGCLPACPVWQCGNKIKKKLKKKSQAFVSPNIICLSYLKFRHNFKVYSGELAGRKSRQDRPVWVWYYSILHSLPLFLKGHSKFFCKG